jgi:branched-chain amino acid transport system permease protein
LTIASSTDSDPVAPCGRPAPHQLRHRPFADLGQLRLPVGTLVACVIAVGAGGLLSVLVERVVIRPLRDARDVTVFVATAGVGLLTIAVGRLFYVDPVQVEPPFGRFTLQFATYTLSTQQIVVILVLVGVAVALVALFASPLGKALLALSREPFAVRLAGLSVAKLSVAIWLLAGLVAGLAGVAEGPNQTLGPGLFTTQFLFPALTGAVLGGLTSLPGAIAGGLAVGIAQSLATAYAADLGIPGPDTIIVFAILLAVLLLRPQGLLAKEG